MLTQNSLVGVRDPFGIRPLVIGKLKNSYVLASETCALDIIGAKFVREVENGEIVLIEKNELKSIKPFPPKKLDHVFLNIFILQDQTVFLMAKQLMNTERVLVLNLRKKMILMLILWFQFQTLEMQLL